MSSYVSTGGTVRFSKSEPGLELFEKKKSMYKISIHCHFKGNAPGTEK